MTSGSRKQTRGPGIGAAQNETDKLSSPPIERCREQVGLRAQWVIFEVFQEETATSVLTFYCRLQGFVTSPLEPSHLPLPSLPENYSDTKTKEKLLVCQDYNYCLLLN